MQTATKTCPVCEHWNRIVGNRAITELKRSEARVALSNHQYFKHLKGT